MTSLSAAAEAPAVEAQSTGHVHHVDMIRLITFATVILVHALAQNITGDNRAGNAIEVVLHFTRNAFIALTAFVLFHSNYRRPLDLGAFWRRRFPVVLIPYVVWTAIYFSFWSNDHAPIGLASGLKIFTVDLLTGNASYHLYFLLVSLQIYAVFPFNSVGWF